MTHEQLILGETLRDAGIDAAQAGAPPDWYAAAQAAVRQICRHRLRFTTDDVWRSLEEDYGFGSPPEPRAMGAVMRHARKQRWCRATEHFRPSERPVAHRKPCRVWESLL